MIATTLKTYLGLIDVCYDSRFGLMSASLKGVELTGDELNQIEADYSYELSQLANDTWAENELDRQLDR